jgi:MFS family permease
MAGMAAANYRAVLTEPGTFRLLSTALVGRLPQGMASLAVLLLVREATHSYAAAGVAVGAGAAGAAVCAPVLGRLLDRFSRRIVVGAAAFTQASIYVLLFLAATAHASTIVLVVCAGCAGALVPPIAPVVRTILGDIFDDASVRETAFGLEAIAQETIWIVGPLLVSIVVAASSPKAAVLLVAAVGVIGTSLFLRSPLLEHDDGSHSESAPPGSALSSVDLRWLLIPVALTGMSLGAIEVGLPSLALHDGHRTLSGFLLALWSLGSVAGGLRYSSMRWRSPLGTRYVMLLLAGFVCTVPVILAGQITVVAVCAFIAGLAIAPTFSCQYSLVGRVITPGTEHEAFSWMLSALIGGASAGLALGGAVIGPVGVKAPFVLASFVSLLAVATGLRFRGRFAPEVEPVTVRDGALV